MQIRLLGRELPGRDCVGYDRIFVGVQRRNKPREWLHLVPGDAKRAQWTFEADVKGTDMLGPYIQGGPGDRFIYLSWVHGPDDDHLEMFRRAKLMVADIPPAVLRGAAKSGSLIARFPLRDGKGNPTCARMLPPVIEWSAG